MTIDVLTTVYVGNALGIALILTLFFSNMGRISADRDFKNVVILLLIAGTACIADPVVYTVDGREGLFFLVVNYVGNSWLYVANTCMARMWIEFLTRHINIRMTRTRRIVYDSIFAVGLILIVVNIFYPIIFKIENNVYSRTAFFWLYVAMAGGMMLDSVILYFKAKKKGGVFTFFPIEIFLLPVVIGVAVQSMFYGISVIWASVAIGISGLMTALKNEIIYIDGLTGIYNRMYLDHLKKDIQKRKNVYVTGIMIDINGFKAINDKYGHSTGDEALVITAKLLRRAVGEYGSVMRYAGDEFVVMLNTVDDDRVEWIVGSINASIDRFNKKKEKPYELSLSMGYSALDLKNQTINDFMNTIDKKMYEQKNAFYNSKGNDRRRR